MQKLVALAILLMLSVGIRAQEMKRRPFLGVSMRDLTDDMVRVMQLPGRQGVLLDKIIPGSTAEKAGFKKGDVLLSINGTATNNGAATSSYVAAQKTDPFTYELLRNGKTIKGKASFMRFPQEKYPDLVVDYTYAKNEHRPAAHHYYKAKNKPQRICTCVHRWHRLLLYGFRFRHGS